MRNSSSSRYPFTYKLKNDNRSRSRSKEKRDRSDDERRRSRSDSERDRSRDKKREKSRSKDKYMRNHSIRIQSKTRIEVGSVTQKSQIKVHFRFDGIKIGVVHEDQLMEKLKTYLSQEYGPVVHFSKSSDSEPGFLIMELGFQTDYSAEKALKGGIDKLMISIYDKTIQVSARPTRIFQICLSFQRKKASKKESSSSRSSNHKKSRKQRNKKKDRKYSRSQSSSFSSSFRSSSSERSPKNRRRSIDKPANSQKFETSRDCLETSYKKRDNYEKKDIKNDSYREKERSYDRSAKESTARVQIGPNQKLKQQLPIFKTVLFWGLHVTLNAKDVDLYLQKHREGPFVSKKQLIWKKLEGFPACQILEGSFEQKMVQKLMFIEEKLEIKDHPFIAIECQLYDRQKIIQKISEYQVNIEFTIPTEPYYLLKRLNECGKVLQIVSNNEFTESGLSNSFNVTFASKILCRKFKSIKKTSKGIEIYEISSEDKFVPVYRPTPTTQLDVKNKFQNSKKYGEELESSYYSPQPSPIDENDNGY